MSDSENYEARYWKIAPGAGAVHWDEWCQGDFVAIGWNDLGNVSNLTESEFEARRDEVLAQHDDWTETKLNQVWDFAGIREGDRVVANQGTSKVLGIGTVVGPYEFVSDVELGHRLPVQWDDLTLRQIQEGNWRNTLRELNGEKFKSIQEAPPVTDNIEQRHEPEEIHEPYVAVRAILWKKLSTTDIRVISGEEERLRPGGGAQPDLRLRRTLVSDEKALEFVAGSSAAEVHDADSVHVTITQRPRRATAPQEGSNQLELKHFPNLTRNEICIMRQKPPHTNPCWADAADGQVDDYIFILRLEDDTFSSGYASADEVDSFPATLQEPMTSSDQGIKFYETETVFGLEGDILAALREHHNVLLYGPPGTGKTYLMQQARQWFLREPAATLLYNESENIFSTEDAHVVAPRRTTRDSRWVTFHQSYTYEDFIGARRPEPRSGTLLHLEPVDGPLLELASTASDAEGAGLLLVDEINRGNVSRIFGEFITLMEPDKRLKEDGTSDPVRTVSVRLPHTGDSFQMPYHVYTLATMNSVDRSIMPLDAALRRRFHTIELQPDYQVLGRLFGIEAVDPTSIEALPDPLTTVEDYGKLTVRLLYEINLFIEALVGADFEAGHGFFWNMKQTVEGGDKDQISSALAEVWDNRLLPHLHELFRSQPNLLSAILRLDQSGKPTNYPYYKQQLPDEVAQVGGISRVQTPPLNKSQNSDAVLRFIAGVAVA